MLPLGIVRSTSSTASNFPNRRVSRAKRSPGRAACGRRGDASTHCYLSGICERVQRRIDSWEARFGQYPQGPGEALSYRSLATEQAALRQIGESLRVAKQGWGRTAQVFAPDLDNRERLRQFDLALADVPERDLQAVRCEAVILPTAPPYDRFARDVALLEEKPVYAFEDLAAVFSQSTPLSRRDYPTVFALFLAVFIDLFVLLVAIGAAVVVETDPRLPLSSGQPAIPEWGEGLSREITSWIDGALLHARGSADDRRAFLAAVIEALSFDNSNRVLFVATASQDRRFGYLMTNARAATASPLAGEGESVTFVLADWVYPALTRYMATG